MYYRIGIVAPEICDTFSLKSATSESSIIKSNYVEVEGASFIADYKKDQTFVITPNPITNGRLELHFKNLGVQNNAKIHILGIDGKIFLVKHFNDLCDYINLDVSLFEDGIYILKIDLDNSVMITKFLIKY